MSFLARLRLVLILSGLVFTVAGLATDNRVVIWVAIGLLGLSLVIRLFLKKRQVDQE